jgi:NAD(P)-dependent dehydrogenase (short-subunit alcohol dehydrogenase family)
LPRLNGKRTLITGGTFGIGLATARQFLAEGARVVIVGNNAETIATAKTELGSDVLAIQADSASVSQRRKLAETVKDHYGRLDFAYLDAGISVWQPIEAWDEEAFDRSFAINVKVPYFLIQALLPVFANPASVVLNTVLNTPIDTHAAAAGSTVYAATKAALLSFPKTLSRELLSRGVRVNAVSSGAVEPPLYDRLGIPDAYREQVKKDTGTTIPFDRFAKALVHVASDDTTHTES